ncbi:extracellular solute-binding protein [Paenibacillus sp. 1P07SE]|uniref:sugar ABC transporter substrate-binding protein n=1 Tax=Paenibacillus sp. 1P07SE TaxID=3132209 RepID=UPI0039A5DF37
MKRVKYFSCLLTAVTVAAVVTACGNGANNPAPGTNTPDNGGTAAMQPISIFQSKVEIAGELEALARTYTEETGNQVEVWGSAGDAYTTQLQARLTANEGPTIFSIQPGQEAERFKSYFYDMSDQSYASYLAPGMGLEIDGKIVGMPTSVEGYGLVYNTELVDPSDVTDLASFTSTLQQLKADGVNGLSLSEEAYFLIGHLINTPFALQEDPQAFLASLAAGEVTMAETPEFQEFAQFLEVIRAEAVNPLEVTYDRQMGDFATGRNAMVHQGNWSYSMLADFDEMDIGMMPFPLMGNDKLAVDLATAFVINGGASEGEIEAANAFLEWLFTSETGQNAIVNDFGFIPAVTNIEVTEMNPLSQAVYDATQSGNTIPWAFTFFPSGIIVNDLAPLAQEFFLSSSMTGEQFLERLDQVWANAS